MIRMTDGTGVSVAVEIWSVPPAGLASILQKNTGLTIGKVRLADGSIVLGVIGDRPRRGPKGGNLKHTGGWRAYIASEGVQS